MSELNTVPRVFSLRIADRDEVRFATALHRTNMLAYYERHGLIWRADLFRESWMLSENYIIESAKVPIGMLRIDVEDYALHIRDLQLIPGQRGLGAGSYTLDVAHELARQRRLKASRLRVFVDNPAARLYARKGYREIASPNEANGIRCLERPL